MRSCYSDPPQASAPCSASHSPPSLCLIKRLPSYSSPPRPSLLTQPPSSLAGFGGPLKDPCLLLKHGASTHEWCPGLNCSLLAALPLLLSGRYLFSINPPPPPPPLRPPLSTTTHLFTLFWSLPLFTTVTKDSRGNYAISPQIRNWAGLILVYIVLFQATCMNLVHRQTDRQSPVAQVTDLYLMQWCIQ